MELKDGYKRGPSINSEASEKPPKHFHRPGRWRQHFQAEPCLPELLLPRMLIGYFCFCSQTRNTNFARVTQIHPTLFRVFLGFGTCGGNQPLGSPLPSLLSFPPFLPPFPFPLFPSLPHPPFHRSSPLSSPVVSFTSLLYLPLSFPSLFYPLEVGPLYPARGSGRAL